MTQDNMSENINSNSNTQWQNLIQEKISRRGFIRGLSALGAGAAVSALPASVAAASSAITAPVPAAAEPAAQAAAPMFAPIQPSTKDDVVVPEGYSYQVVIKRGDVFTKDGKTFGDNADWTGWYPIDGLTGGNSTTEGLLVINNEYLNPMLVSGYTGTEKKTKEQILKEKESVGFAVVHLKKEGDKWTIVKDSDMARRFDATTKMGFSGPVAGTDIVKGAKEVIGTAGNCSGGQTPWMTALSCEENYQSYYGEDSAGIVKVAVEATYRWLEDANTAQPPEHYGWVVEVDPYSGVAKKRTALGRFRHENVAIGLSKDGRVVAYMGDDARDEVVYKFVSEGKFDKANRDANMDILDKGTLYAANFGSGKWIPLVFEGNEKVFADPKTTGGYAIKSQADLLTFANVAARALGATRTDRPEDIEIHPKTGDVYIAFTNNSNHGNFHGQITRIQEKDGDLGSLEFGWDIFSVGGPQSGYSSPDNLIFDKDGNLWMVTDISTNTVAKGIYQFQGNNAMFMFPTEGPDTGKAIMFASGPIESEMTGPTWIGNDTLMLAVQHPGEQSESKDKFTSKWPGGDEPRAGVIAITGKFVGV